MFKMFKNLLAALKKLPVPEGASQMPLREDTQPPSHFSCIAFHHKIVTLL
jgi:hypothetical protein